MEPQGIPGVPADYDAGINHGLGVPAAFYHFAFEAGSEAALAEKRDELRAKRVEVTDIVDHHWSKSIYFRDPNGLSLEYCCLVRNLTEDDATMRELYSVPRAALELTNATPRQRAAAAVDAARVAPMSRARGSSPELAASRLRRGDCGARTRTYICRPTCQASYGTSRPAG